MAINRRFLYAGLFLVALGGVLVAVDLSAVNTDALADVLRLWPVALIAIGAGIALRRSRYALVAGIVAAMIPGLVLGGGLAVAPKYTSECGGFHGDVINNRSDSGTLSAGATVAVNVNCGELTLDTRPGSRWAVTSTTTGKRTPIIDSTADGLSVRTSGGDDWLDADRERLALSLPTSHLSDLNVQLAAGPSRLTLDGADVEHVAVLGNAADVTIDATSALVRDLDGSLDLGRLSVLLPQQGRYTGTLRVNGGQLRICAPLFLGVHVDFSGSPRDVRINGLEAHGSVWENEAYASAANRADLNVRVNFGSVVINPIGGCK